MYYTLLNKFKAILICNILLLSYTALSAQAVVDFNFIETEEGGFTRITRDKIVEIENDEYLILASNYYKHYFNTKQDTIHASDYMLEADTCKNISRTVVLHLDKDFNVLNYTEIKFLQDAHIAVTDDRVFVSYNNDPKKGCQYLYIDDSPAGIESIAHGILEFDRELNFIDIKRTESNIISNMIGLDSTLYYI